MKKVLSLLVVVLFFVSSCETDEPRVEPETYWFVTSITVRENEWQLKGRPGDLNSYYVAYKPLKQLTRTVYEEGAVLAYIETEAGVKNTMPYVLHKGESNGNQEFLWTETYDFDFTTGEIGFYITYSDFNTYIKPGTEKFHVVLIW